MEVFFYNTLKHPIYDFQQKNNHIIFCKGNKNFSRRSLHLFYFVNIVVKKIFLLELIPIFQPSIHRKSAIAILSQIKRLYITFKNTFRLMFDNQPAIFF